MAGYDRIEATQRRHAVEQYLNSIYPNDHLLPAMHAILAQPVSDEQKYKNAHRISQDLELVRDGPDKASLHEKIELIREELYDTYHKKVKNLPPDENFYAVPESVREVVKEAPPPATTIPEAVKSAVESVRSVGADLAEQTASDAAKTGFWTLVGGAVMNAGGRLMESTASSVSSLFSVSDGKADMNAKQKNLLEQFINTVQSGRSLEKSIATYRHKTAADPDGYTQGLKTLLTSDDFQHRLSEPLKDEIEQKYMEHEQVNQKSRWANRGKRKTPSDNYAYDYTGPDTADASASVKAPETPAPAPAPSQTPRTAQPTQNLTPVPSDYNPLTASSTPTAKRVSAAAAGALAGGAVAGPGGAFFGGSAAYLLSENEGVPATTKIGDDYYFQQAMREQSIPPKPTAPIPPPPDTLPSIPRDPSVYTVNQQLDYDEAAWGALGQTILRGGVAGGAYLTKQALQMGGFPGYLGAAALGAGTMSLDTIGRMYGGDYGTSYSTRRGIKVGDAMYDSFSMTNPALSIERGVNALLSTSENERSTGNVVDLFTRSGAQLANSQGMQDSIAQENLALRNWIADSSQIVVPHAY